MVTAFKSEKKDKKSTSTPVEKQAVQEQVYREDKAAKSKKQKARDKADAEAEMVPEKKKKMKFENLKDAKTEGDDVYQA